MSYSLHVSIIGFFYYSSKTDSWWGAFAEGNSAKQPAAAMNTPLPQCHASLGATQKAYSVQLAKPHTHTVNIELDGGREGGRVDEGNDRGRDGGREEDMA